MSQNKAYDKKYCGAKTRAGTPCKRPAGWGTNHVGTGRCKLHGGRSTGAPPEKMKNNQNAKKHGFFSRYIPKETLEIMGMLDEKKPADLIWDQIMIQYAAIIRAQEIMFVTDKNEMIKELKKEKETENSVEVEYEIQFAWDRHATFLNAQSRAMSELRSLIKQFNELAHENDERRLKLEQMQNVIEKTKAETELAHERVKLLKGDKKDTSLMETLISVMNENEVDDSE